MLNGQDVQLFHQLLDSLSTSLRDLVVKYELLLSTTNRSSSEREKTDTAVINLAREVSSSFSSMAKDFDHLKSLSSEGNAHDIRVAEAVKSMTKSVESMEAKLNAAMTEVVNAKVAATEGKDVGVHVDSHMDSFGSQLASMQTMREEVSKVSKSVDEMKESFKPFEQLAILFKKPVIVVMVVYVIVVSAVAAIDLIKQYGEIRHYVTGDETSQTDQKINGGMK